MKTGKLLSTIAALLGTALAAQVAADSAVITYQGMVQSGGDSFTGTGQFKFALVTSTNVARRATASVNVTGGFVTSITVTDGGEGYGVAPAVVIWGGDGSGAAATATVSGGEVVSILVNNAGSGYNNKTAVSIHSPPDTTVYDTYWSNDGTSVDGSEPVDATPVAVNAGLFAVGLGNSGLSNMQALDPILFGQPDLELRIWFNDGVNGFSALSPTQPMTAAPYAMHCTTANSADTVQWADISGVPSGFSGGMNNSVGASSPSVAIGGGSDNVIGPSSAFATVGGGGYNVIGSSSHAATVGGGGENVIGPSSAFATVAGGGDNVIGSSSVYSTIGGGGENDIGDYSPYATVAGGGENDIGDYSHYATVAGGFDNSIGDTASYAFAAGHHAKANHAGAFVWADSTDADFASTAYNEFAVRASGGMRVVGSSTNSTLMVAPNQTISEFDSELFLAEDHDGTFGMLLRYNGGDNRLQFYGKNRTVEYGPHLVINRDNTRVGIGRTASSNVLEVEGSASKTTAGSWLANSDVRIKQNIQPVGDALNKLSQVRLVSFEYTDDYRTDHPSVEDRSYLNVVAQEFAEVFPEHVKGSGETLADGSEILQVDTYPLTIYSAAAIQELAQENAELSERLARLERLVEQLGGAQ